MRFKQWLMLEDFEASPSDITGDQLYPTNAGDYAYANNSPTEHFFLQQMWNDERKIGRKFHNIDLKKFLKIGYKSAISSTLPDDGDGFWEHKPDKPLKKSSSAKMNYLLNKNNSFDRIFKDK